MSAQFTALLAAIAWLQAGAVPFGDHTCTGVIKHPVTVLVNVTEPVTFRSYTWCLRVPPRCSKYTVQLKDRVKLHTEMHNKTITVCCRGYVEMENRCVPACPEDAECPFMKCNRTNHCYCTPGFTGLYCNDPCPRGLWGKDCKRPCDCPSGYTCHHLTGDCFVDDSPPRRTTTTTTTTKRPTTTTDIPTTQGTTLETVKTPVFRYPPPPWVDSAAVGKKTTTRQVRKEEAPPTKEMDAQITPGVDIRQTTTATLPQEVATIPPVHVTKKPSFERPPILEFLPSLPSEESATTKEIMLESTKPKIPEKPMTTTATTLARPTSKLIEKLTPPLIDETISTITKLLLEQTTTTQLPSTKLTLSSSPEVNTISTETPLIIIPSRINLISNQPTQGETVPMIVNTQSKPTQRFGTVDTKLQTIASETIPITTTMTPQPTKPEVVFSDSTTTIQPLHRFNVTQGTKSVENTLENEILTKISDSVLNKQTLKETTASTTTSMIDFSSKTKSTLNPFFLITLTDPPSHHIELISKSKEIDEEAKQIFVNQRETTVPIVIKSTEGIQKEMTISDVKKPEKTEFTQFEDNSEKTLPNRKLSQENFVHSATTKALTTSNEPSTKAMTSFTEQITPVSTTFFKQTTTTTIPTTSTNPTIEVKTTTVRPTESETSTVTIPLPTSTTVATTTGSTTPASILTSPTTEATTTTIPNTTPTTIPSTATTPTTIPSTTTTPTTIPSTTSTPTTIPSTTSTPTTIPSTTTTPTTIPSTTSTPTTIPSRTTIPTTIPSTTTTPTTIPSTTPTPTTFATTTTGQTTVTVASTITTPTVASTNSTPVITSTITTTTPPPTNPPSIATSTTVLPTKKYSEITESEVNQHLTWPRIFNDDQTTLSIPEIIEEVLKELSIHKKTKLDETPANPSNQDKSKKKHDRMKNKNINVKEFPSIYQTKVEKQSETVFQPTTEISFKSILHAETFMNKSFSTKSPLPMLKKQPLPDLMNIEYVTDGFPFIETANSKPPTPGNRNQLWHPLKKQNNASETDYKEQEQFSVLEEPSNTSPTHVDEELMTEMNKVVESNTIDYRQGSEEPLKKMSQEDETNYSLISNKIKFNMTDSVAAGVQASRSDPYLHTPMILVLGIALVTLFLLTLALWVYLRRRRERAQPFPPCIMAYDMQERPPTAIEPDSFDHPFFCPTFTNTYGEKINRELRELSYDHPRSSQPEPLYAEIRH